VTGAGPFFKCRSFSGAVPDAGLGDRGWEGSNSTGRPSAVTAIAAPKRFRYPAIEPGGAPR
jgi:hypothetical protein